MAKTAPQIHLPFIRISRREKKAVYLQIYESFREAILQGALKPGDRLPASRQLAAELGVSRNVLVLAMEQLQLEGYIVARTGQGSYVAENIRQEGGGRPEKEAASSVTGKRYNKAFLEILADPAAQANSVLEEIKPFQLSVPDTEHFPFNAWIRLAAKVHRHMATYHLGYHDAAGHGPLREAIAQYLRVNRGVRCTPEQVVITNGSRQALWLLAQLLLRRGDSCWMENPGYPGMHLALQHVGAVPCYIPVTREHGLDVDYAIREYPHARLAYLTPSHQYPLGGTIPLAKRQQLIRWASRTGAWIIEDDYDSELQYSGRPIPALQGLDESGQVIYVGTFSKVLFPALRLAYVVMPDPADARLLALAKAVSDRQHSLIDQMILTEFIQEGHYLRMLKKMRLHYGQKLKYFSGLLREYLADFIDFRSPEAGMHLACYFRDPSVADSFFVKLAQSGLIVSSLQDFAHPPYTGQGFTLGYLAFSEKELLHGVRQLKEIFLACRKQGKREPGR